MSTNSFPPSGNDPDNDELAQFGQGGTSSFGSVPPSAVPPTPPASSVPPLTPPASQAAQPTPPQTPPQQPQQPLTPPQPQGSFSQQQSQPQQPQASFTPPPPQSSFTPPQPPPGYNPQGAQWAGGYGAQPGQPLGYQAPPQPGELVQGSGRIDFGRTLSKSFTLVFRNLLPFAGFTALGGFVLSTILGLASTLVGSAAFFGSDPFSDYGTPRFNPVDAFTTFLMTIMYAAASAAALVWAVNGALQVVEARLITFKDFFNLRVPFANAFLVTFLTVLAVSLSHGVFTILGGSGLGFIASGLFQLVVFFGFPLILLAPCFAIDRGMPVAECFKAAIAIGQRHYFLLLGLALICSTMIVISFFTIIGVLITMPASWVWISLAYRQSSGGVHEVV